MHTRTLARSARRKSGLYLLDGWRRADSLYSERERAALAWTEAL
ncbi:hypothetical protein [Mesorhizobium sp. M0998]